MLLRRSRLGRIALGVVIAAAVAIVVLLAETLSANRGIAGASSAAATFKACIAQRRFLDLTEHRSRNGIIEVIRDRSNGAVAGQFAALPSVRAAGAFVRRVGTITGSGAGNGRYVLLTTAAVGRDAAAIQRCGQPEFPGP